MADHDDIEELVAHPEDQALRLRANIYLKSINNLIKSSDIYIMTLNGKTIAASNKDLIQAGKLAALGQMMTALSHEFNQPLAAAKTYAESASLPIKQGRVDEAIDNHKRISVLIDRMAAIGKYLRNFARKPNEKLGPVSLCAVVSDTLEIVNARLKAADAVMEVDFGSSPIWVKEGPVRPRCYLLHFSSSPSPHSSCWQVFITARNMAARQRPFSSTCRANPRLP